MRSIMPNPVYRDTDASPKEAFVYHAAGFGGSAFGGAALQSGGSSYIDSVILRDRDNYTSTTPNPMTSEADGTLEERRFYCQNWRADVVAITRSDGTPIEYVRYSSYGEPTVYPVADLNMDGVVNSTDDNLWGDLLYVNPCAAVYADSDLDWDGADDWTSSGTDTVLFQESYSENVGKSGKGRVSSPGVGNRKGYAAYEWDQVIRANHVRFRVYFPEIGRWGRRDPLGYVATLELYMYVASRAVHLRDPLGLEPDDARTPEEVKADVCSALQDAIDKKMTTAEFLKTYATTFGQYTYVFNQTHSGSGFTATDIDWLLTLLYVYYHGIPLSEPGGEPMAEALRGIDPAVLYVFGKSIWIILDSIRDENRHIRDFKKRFGQLDEWMAVAMAHDVASGKTDLIRWLADQFGCDLRSPGLVVISPARDCARSGDRGRLAPHELVIHPQ